MKCKDIEKKLSAYLEGSVSSKEKEGVENHLSSCQSCGKVFEELKRTNALIKGLEQVEPPPWFTQKIMSCIQAEQESKKSALQRLFYPLHIKVPLEAFATVLIAVTAVYLFKASEPEMKRIHIPAVAEQAASKDEGSKEPTEPQGDTTIAGGKVALEGVPKLQKQKGITREKDRAEEEELKQKTAPPTANEIPSSLELAEKREAPKESPKPSELSSQHVQAQRQFRVPAGVEQETDSAAKAPARGEEVEGRALSDEPQITASAVRKPWTIDVTLRTRDSKTASRDVENILNQLGAQNIEKEPLQNTEILKAELHAEKIQKLLEKLKLLGEVKDQGLPPEHPKEITKIRIEIMSPP